MTDFGAIDALLAGARKEVPLPPAGERRILREELNLSRSQLAEVLGVSPSTVGGWESGRDPSGETRVKYAYFLDGAQAKLAAESVGQDPAGEPGGEVAADAGQGGGQDDGDVDVLATPEPCVLCGQPARYRVEGFAQHLDPAECGTSGPVHKSRPEAAPDEPTARTAPAMGNPPAGSRSRDAGSGSRPSAAA